MYSKAVAASAQLAVYIAAVHTVQPDDRLHRLRRPVVRQRADRREVLQPARTCGDVGASSPAKIQSFKGPQFGISGPMKCGFDILLPAVCGKYMGMAQFIGGHWVPNAGRLQQQVDQRVQLI